MRKILLFISLLLVNISFANTFDTQQERLIKLKDLINEEEYIARAFEKYILEEKDIPSLSDLKTDDYLGTSYTSTYLLDSDSKTFSITANENSMKNRIRLSVLNNESELVHIYEDNAYRTRTYVKGDKVYIIFKDDLAKHLYYLLKVNTTTISDCPSSGAPSTKLCKENDHLYVYNDSRTDLLMFFKFEKFKEGPIIINDDIAFHSNKAYRFIPTGTLIYDFKGNKYIKTTDNMVRVQ